MLTLRKCRELFVRHLHFVGPGLVSSVAYIDPGNWATDLQAGAGYGYKLLFIVLISGFAAVVLQLLAVRLGATTSLSLPAQTRLLFMRLQTKYPKYQLLLKLTLWALYGLAEVAIIGTDLAELLGSAIALNLLFPRLPLFAGVLITAADVLVVLVFFRSNSGRQGMLLFEIVIVSLVLAVFVSFMILLHLIRPEWKEVFLGLVPSHTLVEPGALYVGVGIIGATVMPHALFLGSSLASVDRLNMLPTPPTQRTARSVSMPSLNILSRLGLRRAHCEKHSSTKGSSDMELRDLPNTTAGREDRLEAEAGLSQPGPSRRNSARDVKAMADQVEEAVDDDQSQREGRKETKFEIAQREYEADLKTFDRIAWVDLHVLHSTIDTSLSLLGFALTINAAILTLAGAAYFYGTSGQDESDASLEGAYELIKGYIGSGAALIFALALLCAGQSASITATLAGQVVSEGFIEWKTSPFIRRLITRLIGVIPAAIIAAAAGTSGLNTMLVASQVLLSIVLPSVIFPLVYLCSKDEIMSVLGPEIPNEMGSQGIRGNLGSRPVSPSLAIEDGDVLPSRVEVPLTRKRKFYTSPKWVTGIGYLLFGVVVVANVYVIVELGLGN